MKYLKTFENIDPCLIYDDCRDSYVWKIPTKYPYIIIALKKIGMDQHNIDFYSKRIFGANDPYCLIFKTINKNGKCDWSYAGLEYHNPDYRKPPVQMGEVKVEDYEVDAEKYNL